MKDMAQMNQLALIDYWEEECASAMVTGVADDLVAIGDEIVERWLRDTEKEI